MEKDVKLALIGGLFTILVCVLYTVLPHLLYPTISNIEIVDANIMVLRDTPSIDIKVRNIGKDVSVIKKVDIDVINASIDNTPRISCCRSINHDSMEVKIKNYGWGPALNVTFKDLCNAPELISILGINENDLLWQGNISEGETIRMVYPFNHYMNINLFMGYHNLDENHIFSGSVFGSISYWDVYGHCYSSNMTAEDSVLLDWSHEKYWITNDTIYFDICGGAPLPPSANYTITLDPEKKLPYTQSVYVSHELLPNTADRFEIQIDSNKTASYHIKARIYYNEDNVVETKIMRLKMEKVNSAMKVREAVTTVTKQSKKVVFDETRLCKNAEGWYENRISETKWYGCSDFAEALRNGGFNVSKISTKPITYEKLEGYDVLIIFSSVEDYSITEIDAIEKFVRNGGGLFLVCDSRIGDDKIVSFPTNSIAKRFGVTFAKNGDICDPTNHYSYNNTIGSVISFKSCVKISDIEPHAITKYVSNFYFIRGTYIIDSGSSNILAYTDNDVWFDKFELLSWGDEIKDFDETTNRFPVLSKMSYEEGKIVFIGDDFMFANFWSEKLNNMQLGLNIVRWLC